MRSLRIGDLKVRDVMSLRPVTASPDEPLSDVLGKMRKWDVHEVPIVEKENLLGLVSYSTLIKRRNLPLTTRVESIMTKPPAISEEDDLISLAETLMVSGYRGVPVASKNRLVGFVSRTDVVRAMKNLEETKAVRLRSIMTPTPQCVREDDDIMRARQLMINLDERAVPVLDSSGKLAGVVGVKDLAKVMWKPAKRETAGETAGEKGPVEIQVKSIMHTPAISLGPQASVAEASDLMTKHNISSVIVKEEGKPVGIVTQVDLMELVASFKAREQLYVQITGLEDEVWAYESMYDIIQKSIRRISDIVKPTMLSIHVVQHRSTGRGKAKYSIRARMVTNNGMYFAWDYDWDIFKALDKVMEQLEKRVKREKELRLDERRRGRRA